ncbi:MAG: hypothetical protein R3B48_10960 [Kofleriaceae bacterium]
MSRATFFGVAALSAAAFTTFIRTASADGQPQRARQSVSRCASFDQVDKDEVSLELTVRNGCTMPLDCRVSWRLVCAPEAKKRRTITPSSVNFTVQSSAARATEISAAACGDDAWVIRDVSWRCEPNQD